jgi:starch phosphorylase
MFDKKRLQERMKAHAAVSFGRAIEELNARESHIAFSKAIMEDVVPLWTATREKQEGKKKACYFSAEFLMGRALGNNLMNLGINDEAGEMLGGMGLDINDIEEAEEDAGLGNGGLGRLAACFLDSGASLGYPLHGYGIRYEYGIFKQSIKDGAQVEEGDNWLEYGDPWSVRRLDEAVEVSFFDGPVLAVPYDTPVIGYGGKTVNTLRLWKAEAIRPFGFREFNDEDYEGSVRDKNNAETITKVLYPNDCTDKGKLLRLRQQYFFVSASLQDILAKHVENGFSLESFPDYHAIQLNDTHPAVAVPELMRLLTEVHGMDWDEAFDITRKTLAYTNHTILAEALEQWPVRLYRKLLPGIYGIIRKIDRQLQSDLRSKGIRGKAQDRYRILLGGSVKMAWLSIYGTHSTNGVAELHTELLKETELKHWYDIYPERFNNKTNGITQRRWLKMSNPELSALVTELLGTDGWIIDLDLLKGLRGYKDDANVLERLNEIKRIKKVQLALHIRKVEGIEIDPDSIFDIQIKRLHEYKRQLLNAFQILDLYYRIKEGDAEGITPRTFIFGAKAAPGYKRAKGIIKYINEIAKLVNNDPETKDKLKVVFVTNYRVSYAEKLFPSADISEQISTAGKEASGTGNMKFMLNGAPTIGTLDGANIEIAEEAGMENSFIFGLTVDEIEDMKETYDPHVPYAEVPGLKRVVDSLVDGTFDDGGTGAFRELHDSLLKGASWHKPDNYFILADFASYREAQEAVGKAYKDRLSYARKCLMNISGAGKFSSDRTIMEYADEIWDLEN